MIKDFTLLIVLSLVSMNGIANGQMFQDGSDAYINKEYRKAFEIWRQLAKKGDANLFFWSCANAL